MAKARRLTEDQRLRIAKERSEGVSAADLSSRYGVSLKSVYNAVHHAQGRGVSNGSRERVIGLRLSGAELRRLDACLSRRGISHRADALRRLVMAADDLLAPDAHMTEEMRRLGAGLNRVGNTINQIARRLNEGRVKGEAARLAPSETVEIRALAGLVFTLADQIQDMSRNRRAALTLEIDKARIDAVRAVNPALFDRGWSKVSGSASGGLGRRAQMVRGHAPAIFKPIRQGRCRTVAQLRAHRCRSDPDPHCQSGLRRAKHRGQQRA